MKEKYYGFLFSVPIDREDLLTAASKDVFDMSLLSESLPSSTVDNRLNIKAEKVTKEFLSFLQLRLQAFRKYDLIFINFEFFYLCIFIVNEAHMLLTTGIIFIDL